MRHLFGPVNAEFTDQFLNRARDRGNCRTFGTGADLDPPSDANWGEVESRLPSDWRPDFIALWLPYVRVPAWVWSAPVPVIGLAADWNLLFHDYRTSLPKCDAILTDETGVEVLRREGHDHVRYGNLFGVERAFLDEPNEEATRDIDVLFVGNLQSAVQRERLPWLGWLAQIGERWNVRIASGVFGRDYRDLLRRARIVFNRSIRGECNKRTFEAPACGALLFQEAENREVRRWLEEGTEFVAYTAKTLAPLLDEYLGDEDRRRAVADAGRARVQAYRFDDLWSSIIDELRNDWPEIQSRAEERAARIAAVPATPPMPLALARLAEIGALGRSGRRDDVLRLARDVLLDVDRAGTWLPQVPGLQPWREFDQTRVEWEKAAWANAGDPSAEAKAKRGVLRWRVHLELAEISGDIAHHYEAVLAKPDIQVSRAALGCALARHGRFAEAVPHMRRAVSDNPFDLSAARAYGQLLRDTNQSEVHAALCRQRRLLAKAAPGIVPAEDWFTPSADSGALASIIILCCNEAEATRDCLDSVRRYTRQPYELILVDNGSTDATPQLLAEMKQCWEPARVEVIRNEKNVGYPAGVNQGLAAAKGEWLVLHNNDTVVTPCWLDDLIGVAIANGGAEMVGPVSNYAPEPQLLPAGYESLAGLDEFAQARRRQFAGRYLEFERLTGFCLLLRRQVLEKVGAMDERYGAGFFDDDDLCLRARRAGFKLRVALGVYIHHEGSRTFRAQGIDTAKLLQENLGKFRDKWGEEAAAPYKVPAAPAGTATFQIDSESSPTEYAPGVSLTMIVRNEEANIADCLNSVRDLVDEMIVVDTGSTDRTKEIAVSLGAKVYDFPWIDNFAAARNASLEPATRQWVFWMDADDRLDAANREKLRTLIASLPDANVAYSMKCRCIGQGGDTVVDHVRLFRNDSRHRWCFRVHEQMLPALKDTGTEPRFCDVEVLHVGYADPALVSRKRERDLRLLEMELRERPDHPYALFNLGSVLRDLRRHADALPHLEKSLRLSHARDSIVRKLHAMIAQCHLELGKPAEAAAACTEGRREYPDDPEILFIEGRAREATGDVTGAESCLRRLVDGQEDGDHFASVNPALRSCLGRHQLALLLFRQKRCGEAEAQWRTALSEEPAFKEAWLWLGEIYVQTKKWDLLEQAALGLGDHPEAEVLRGRAKLGRKEFAAARWALSQAAEKYPKEVRPRIFLSHALLQEGKDWAAAEQALRDVLNLDPGNAEARSNLDVLMRQLGKA